MSPYRVLALGWILALTLLHLWMIGSGRWPLSGDEAHYWEWSRRLDWSYYSKGPLVAYLIALSTRFGAHTEFWVRLPAVLLGIPERRALERDAALRHRRRADDH